MSFIHRLYVPFMCIISFVRTKNAVINSVACVMPSHEVLQSIHERLAGDASVAVNLLSDVYHSFLLEFCDFVRLYLLHHVQSVQEVSTLEFCDLLDKFMEVTDSRAQYSNILCKGSLWGSNVLTGQSVGEWISDGTLLLAGKFLHF